MKIDIVKEKVNQEYLGIQGDEGFVAESIKLAFGNSCPLIK
jgi:aspartate/tyrosine/aromatic aminotransferase